MNTTPLEKIGLTAGESKVYLALLKKGQTSAGPVVKEAGISRSKVYEILERLQSKGLASSIIENGIHKFKAIDPCLIPDYLEKKKQEISQEQEEFSAALPRLLAEMKEKNVPQHVEVYSGWPGIKNIFNLLIKDAKKGEIWHAFGIPESMAEERARFFRHWRKETDAIGITQKLIVNYKIKNSPELAPKSKYSHIRYTTQETPTSVDIFREYTLLGVWTGEPLLILIKGKEVADSFRIYFEHMWDNAKK